MYVAGNTTAESDRPASGELPKRRGAGVRRIPALAAGALLLGATLIGASQAEAAIVPTIDLKTAGDYSVLGGETVTNTGASTLQQNLGVSPGSSATGFPPGIVGSATHVGDAEASQAQSDLTTAYIEAAGRLINETTTANLAGLTLVGGVYAGTAKGALLLDGTLVLDGQGDPNSVFIFQTDSSLTAASGSTVSLINGAQQCNVFWQVGSSATIETGSTFIGNIMALTSISVKNGATIRGRALARNGAVTLDNNVFTTPTCDLTPPATTTTTTEATSTTVNGGAGSSTVPGVPGGGTPGVPGGGTPGVPGGGTPGPVPGDVTLPATGRATGDLATIAALLLLAGTGITFLARRSQART